MDEQQAAVGGPPLSALHAENEVLRERVQELAGRVQQLEAELRAREERVLQLEEQVAMATARVTELEHDAQRRRKFGQAARQRPDEAAKPRRARAAEQNRARRLDPPTACATHAYERCPACDYPLRGGSVWWERQVVDLPPPAPVVVTQHTFVRRWCPVCQQWCVPPLPADAALGQGRLGLGVASLVATLRTALRLPIAQIQLYLATLHGLHLSRGAIVDLLRRVAQVAAPAVADLQAQAQASPVLHADETGWREDGQHGYIWLLTTPGPQPVCYFERDASRAHAVFDRLRGPTFAGHLVTDFYGAYNSYPGKHQRCWVHLLRLLHDLKERQPHDAAACAWARAVRRLYDRAMAFVHATDPPTPAQRHAYYDRLVAISHRLGLRYAQAPKGHPCRALAKLLLRHEAELFQFVLVPGLSADNNLAERRIRPLAVARKISGGTRSPEGSAVRMRLASLFATWQARGLNPFTACLALLVSLLSHA
jgi:transposase